MTNTVFDQEIGAKSNAELLTGVGAKLDEFALLQPNWDGYSAAPIRRDIINAVRHFVAKLPAITSRPRVVPMSNGAIQLEWHRGPKILELEFEDADTIHYLQWDPANRMEEEDTFSVADTARAFALIGWFADVTEACPSGIGRAERSDTLQPSAELPRRRLVDWIFSREPYYGLALSFVMVLGGGGYLAYDFAKGGPIAKWFGLGPAIPAQELKKPADMK